MDEESADGTSLSRVEYVLGHTDAELERLRMQARLIDPITRELFVDAGVAPGMRVLHVGSRDGDVAFLVGALVGPSGTVVGVDRSATAIAMANQLPVRTRPAT